MNVLEMTKFYEQYKADQRDGFVSNTKVYVERKLGALPKENIDEIVEELETRFRNDHINKHP